MAYHDFYRLSCHAVITNVQGQVLLLKATYADHAWGLPGGGVDVGETIHEALHRECLEELNCEVEVDYLSGVYFHSAVMSHVFIFRCRLQNETQIRLSSEHSDYDWFNISTLPEVQKIRVTDCIEFSGKLQSRSF